MKQDEIRYDVNPDIREAKTLNTHFYLDAEAYEHSKEKIFAQCWQFVGDSDQIGEPGWVTPVQLLPGMINEPLVLTRDKEGKEHCLSNVCTHRGNLLIEKPCRLNDMRCKYHGRRFHLDGKFLSMPEFKEVKTFLRQKITSTNFRFSDLVSGCLHDWKTALNQMTFSEI